MRIVIFLLLLSFCSVSIALYKNASPSLPRLSSGDIYKPLMKPAKPLAFPKDSTRRYTTKKKLKRGEKARKEPIETQIRAGFYVNWDLQSYFSLRNNISKMNMVVPEWLFVDSIHDSIICDIDPRAFALLDSSKAKIVPLLTNDIGDVWRDSIVNDIVQSPSKRTAFIRQLLGILKKWGFDGVSVDFEDLTHLKDAEELVEFHRELYDSLHANHYLATQCIPPFNEDYRIDDLHKFNDYIFIMAYDQHYPETKPGPVSDDKWVESVLNYFTGKLDADKFVLCIAGYGYDWPKGGAGVDVTYEEALTVAKESEGKIIYDNNGYNLHYTYLDDDNHPHEVWFTDAATNYNTMRSAANYGLAGVAMWRLGSEDPRLWNFYAHDLADDSVKADPTDLTELESVHSGNNVDYIGEGEVLDILSSPEPGKISLEYDNKDLLISEENYEVLPTSYVIKKFGKAKPKDIFLTFDDGPDPKYTPEILDILKQEHVPAAFFMVGVNMLQNPELVKRIYDEGYEIGNHTFTHPNIAEINLDRAKLEMNATRRLIEIYTGHSTVMFRPPYNADAEPQDLAEIIPVEESRRENYITIGESIDPQDWDAEHINADTIFNRIVAQQSLGNVILLHDAGGNRSATVEALPKIIHYYKEHGYRFATIAELLGKSKEELMPAVTSLNQQNLNKANFFVAGGITLIERFIYGLFLIGIFLSIARIIFMGLLASIQNRKSVLRAEKCAAQPFVSVIIPAYNESVTAPKTLSNLLLSNYPDFEIIFVNDGSKDDTYEVVKTAFEDNKRVRVLNKPNGGKASALNLGIEHAKGDFVICIDADTQLKPDAISKLMESFTSDEIGAVAGNVKVGNQVNWLTKWQSIEYTTAQNFDRKAFDMLNCITVVPGAIGAFRKSAIKDAGGFTSDTLAEDCDLTIRILRCGYRITTNNAAISMTEAPEKLSQFLRQRFRWCFGVMQTFWKNRDACFNSKYKALGWIALPNILIFQIVLPIFAPLVDLMMLIALVSGNGDNIEKIGFYYLVFQVVDLAGSILAFSFERENILKLWMLIPQRFTYRWLMYYILFKAINRALKGELQHWGVLKRTGNVKVAT